MTIYRIANWSLIFENNRSKELKKLTWVPVPNSHDSHGYATLVSRKNGPALYGAWMVIVQVASRCDPRGTLLRGGKIPHTSASLSLMTRFPESLIRDCLEACSDSEIGWIICENSNDSTNVAVRRENPAVCRDEVALGCLEGNGREWKEQNGMEHPAECEPDKYSKSRIALVWLNEHAGRHYRETSGNLALIHARLDEVHGDLEGVKQMVLRQCQRWKGTEQAEYLRPETLFGKEKFNSYYDNRDIPANNGRSNGEMRNGQSKEPSTFENKTRREALEEMMKDLKNRFSHDSAMGTEWTDAEKKKAYLKMKTERDVLTAKLAGVEK